jgi:hypothetical protein
MTTTCGEIRDQLSAYVDGELEAADRHVVSNHLASCAECHDAADAFREIGDLLRRPPASRLPLASELNGLAAGVIIRARAEESQSWHALATRACEDWHWPLAGAGALAAAVFSLVVVWAICSFSPQPAREDSLAALLNNLQAPAGRLLIIATPIGRDQVPVLMQFDAGEGDADIPVLASLPDGFGGPSGNDLALALSEAVVGRDGRLSDLRTMSTIDRKKTEALLDDIQRLRAVPFASWSGRRVNIQKLEFVTNTNVVGKDL